MYFRYMISENQWKMNRHIGDKFTWSKPGKCICTKLLEADYTTATLKMFKKEKDKFEDFSR